MSERPGIHCGAPRRCTLRATASCASCRWRHPCGSPRAKALECMCTAKQRAISKWFTTIKRRGSRRPVSCSLPSRLALMLPSCVLQSTIASSTHVNGQTCLFFSRRIFVHVIISWLACVLLVENLAFRLAFHDMLHRVRCCTTAGCI